MPPLPIGVLRRPRIEEKIRQTPAGGVLVIESAPGYGATTAVAQGLSGVAQTRWLSLDGSVPDEQAAALVADLLSTEQGSPWCVVDGLIPGLHISTCAVLREGVRLLGARARLVVISQGQLDLPGAVVHDEAFLEFTDDEAMELLATLVDTVDVDAASRLIEDAAGWASALVAGAYRMRAGHLGDRFSSVLPAELLDPWLQAMPAERRQLLTDVSAVDEFNAPLAGAATGVAEAVEILIETHAYTHACPTPQGHSGRWFRLHPMLLELLRQRCEGDPAASHTRAAHWYARAGDVRRAMDQFIAAGRYRDAVDLLEDHQGDLLSTGSAGNVLRWYAEIAEEHDRIAALLRAAWGRLLAGDIAGADGAIARLHAAIEMASRADPQAERVRVWRCEQALLDSYTAGCHGDPTTVVRAGNTAMNHLSLSRNPNVAQMAPLLIARGFIWSGDYRAATDAAAACADVRFSNRVLGNLNLGGIRALLACLSGEINQAAEIVDQLWAWAQANGIDIGKVPMFSPELARAFVLVEQGVLDEGQRAASAVLDKARDWHHICDATLAQLIVVRAMLYAGKTGDALQELTAAADLATSRRADTALRVPIGHLQAQVHMAAGDMLRAERLLRELPASPTRTLLSAQAGLIRTPVLALKSLEALSPANPREVAQRHLLLSASCRRASPRIADEHLRAAAVTARRAGLQMLLAPPEPGVRRDAERLAQAGDLDVAWTLGSLGPVTHEPNALSRGDLQLLGMIASRARNQDLADALGISVNTVKTRLRRLYANLGVTDRDQAIAVARQRGLLV